MRVGIRKIDISLFFLGTGYHGYVVKVSNVKCSPNKVKYFNALMHDGEKETPIVSYNTTLHSIYETAHTTDKVLKVINFKNHFDDFKEREVLTLGEPSRVEYSNKELPFEKVKNAAYKMNTITPLQEVISKVCVDEMVNVLVFANTEESKVQEITTKFGIRKKKDVYLSDESFHENVKLFFWNDHVDSIKEDGAYKLQDVRVKSYNGKYLTTTGNTIIKRSDEVIAKKELCKIVDEEVVFPAEAISQFEIAHFCNKCGRRGTSSTIFLLCDHCNSKSLMKKCKNMFLVKLSFSDNIVLILPHDILCKFTELVGIDLIDGHEESIQEKMLSVDDIKAVYHPRTRTITELIKL